MIFPNLSGFDTPFFSVVPVSVDVLRNYIDRLSIYSDESLSIGYMKEISVEELFVVVSNFEINMAGISNQQKVLLLDIASKEYVNTIDRSIRSSHRDAKWASARSQFSIMEAKILAMESDKEQLNTLQKEITLAIDRQNLIIKENEAKIDIEIVNAAFVEAEIIQKQVEVARAELDELRAYQKVVDYQIQVVETGIESARVPAEIAQLKADRADLVVRLSRIEAEAIELDAQRITLQSDIDALEAKKIHASGEIIDYNYRKDVIDSHITDLKAQYETLSAQMQTNEARRQSVDAEINSVSARIETTNAKLAQYDYELAKVEVDAAQAHGNAEMHRLSASTVSEADAAYKRVQAEASAWPEKLAALKSRIGYVNQERSSYSALESAASDSSSSKISSINSRANADISRSEGEAEIAYANAEAQIQISDARAAGARDSADMEKNVAQEHSKIYEVRTNAEKSLSEARISAAGELAKANVKSMVYHSIGGK